MKQESSRLRIGRVTGGCFILAAAAWAAGALSGRAAAADTAEQRFPTSYKSAVDGDMWAQYSIGIQFMNEEGQDYEQARAWFLKAADQGLWAADTQIGSIYFEGKGVAKNFNEARTRFLRAASHSPDRSSAPKDPMDALSWSLAELTRGYAEAYLSQIYSEGDGVQIDMTESRRWLAKAADYKIVFAEAQMGKMWQDGIGGPRSDAEARKWYILGAQGGDPMAENNLGAMLEGGAGGPRSYSEAVAWYRKAAAQDYVTAMTNMGSVYYHGNGVPKDYKQAREWFLKAADHDDAMAEAMLGVLCEEGDGVPKDSAVARKWFKQAAEKGIVLAQLSVGIMYFEGMGGVTDRQEGRKWLQKAAQQGNSDAINYLSSHRNYR